MSACQTEGCENEGVEFEVIEPGLSMVCGVCGKWIIPPVDDEPIPVAEIMRQAAYRQEADPLFFKWQRGEATEQEWLDKVQEIRDRYPDET